MASNAATVYTVTPVVGFDLDDKSSTPATKVLTAILGSDGKKHVYARASEALGSSSTIRIRSAGSASSDAGSAGYTCNTTGGVAAGQFFWAMQTAI